MHYTVRYAHLLAPAPHVVGDTIIRHEVIGVMGNTGQSTGAHLHIDVVRHKQERCWLLSDVDPSCRRNDMLWPDPVQLNHFIDDELFGVPPRITTYYMDPAYQINFGKRHPAYDVVPTSGLLHNQIFWNRSNPGTVEAVGFHPGYGNFILVSYET